jgi:hypothetical protein
LNLFQSSCPKLEEAEQAIGRLYDKALEDIGYRERS